MTQHKYAARLNSFLSRPDLFWPGKNGEPTAVELLERAAVHSNGARVRGMIDAGEDRYARLFHCLR